MTRSNARAGFDRRTIVKSGLVLATAQVASPFVMRARAADAVKIGLDNPLTGTYAAPGKNELIGCQLAVEQINAKGGILGRTVELVVEDSTSGDAGTAVQKARKLIDGDKVDFLLGNVNSALALAMAQVSNEKNILHIVPGGHTDAITGASCHWNVFRVCNTTQMEANAVASALVKEYGKKFYYITPDYAFGHTLEAGMVKASAALGGERVGGDLTPLGTVDFSSYLIKAQAANPDVIIFLVQGDDMVNALKQAVQFGLEKKVHLAGAQQEMEPLEGLPPEARIGTWVMEWYWNQPGVPHVAEFVDADQEAHRPRADRAHLVRLRLGLDLRAGGGQGQFAGRGRDGQGAAGFRTAARNRASGRTRPFYRAGQNQLIGDALCRQRPGERRGAGRPVQGHRGRQRRRCRRLGRGERLQDDLAGLSGSGERRGAASVPPVACRANGRMLDRMTQLVLFNVFNGLIVGAFYALMALGLSLILNLSGVINFAHGGFLALGAYLAYTLIPYVGFWGALIVAPLLTAALGLVVERLLIRPLYGARPALRPAADLRARLYHRGRDAPDLGRAERAVPGAGLADPRRSSQFFFLTGYRVFMILFVAVGGGRPVRRAQLYEARHAHPRGNARPRHGVDARGQRARAAQPQLRHRHLHRRAGRRAGGGPAGAFADHRAVAHHAELRRDHRRRPRQPARHAARRPADRRRLRPRRRVLSLRHRGGDLCDDGSGAAGSPARPPRRGREAALNATRATRRRRRAVWVALLTMPFWMAAIGGYTELATRILVMALAAMSLNFLLGFTGVLSFGHAAYFGLGAYGAAMTIKYLGAEHAVGAWRSASSSQPSRRRSSAR